ncbi:MAG: phospholipid/cholesterol/gamma-HCH transport system substrate-binding protein [Thermoleophilaceae bacterium]|nr:phospholipid/cholesterol/gamma-HCH transport system substrate-binding protein [Thermoleophilaceae bacterium]
MVGRALTLAALAVAVVATAALMFGAGDGYRVSLTLDNAGQLVEGNQVKVGGRPVGLIESIELQDDARARIEVSIDDDIAPLHEGTVMTLRATSLSGIANRYLALEPGRNDEPEIPDGGEVRAEDGRETVDLDQLLNTLDAQTQHDLQAFVRNAADAFADQPDAQATLAAARQANAGLESLNPAIAQTGQTFRALMRDQADLERFIVRSADVVEDVSARPEHLDPLVGNALGAVGALARESTALESSLRRLPPTLRKTNSTLVNLRATLGDVRPLVRDARPAAPLLSDAFDELRPFVRDARPVIGDARATIDRAGTDADLLGVLAGLVRLSREAVPAFDSTVATVTDALPIVREARPYVPDVIGGLFNGFGGTTSGYYDANGHYARISFQGSTATLTGLGSLVPRPPEQQGLSGFRTKIGRRCPGAGTQPAADGSSPYRDTDDFPCDPEDTPR